jgi:N-acetylmuramoyl-L-alanine amidase
MAKALGRNLGFGGDVGGGSTGDGQSPRSRARAEIASAAAPATPLPQASGRRLSDQERRALQERRRSLEPAPPPPPAPPEPSPPPRTVSKPVPRMPPRAHQRQAGASRGLIAVGAVLIAGLTVIALGGGRLFGSAGSDEPPRASVIAAANPRSLPAAILGTPGPMRNGAAVAALAVATPAPTPAFAGGRPPIVCLDPGHGGPDRGFQREPTDAAPAMDEAVLVLQHAWDLEARLKQLGYQVVMTRRTDIAVNSMLRDVNGDGKTARNDKLGKPFYRNLDELQARINICNAAHADLLVSMHINGYSTIDPRGFETWYTKERTFGDRNYEFAALAYTQLKKQLTGIGYELPAEERGVLPDTTANVDNEHSFLPHFVLTGPDVPKNKIVASKMPGAIVEALFISNDYDAAILASPVGRATIVTAYENAIIEYFNEYPPGH